MFCLSSQQPHNQINFQPLRADDSPTYLGVNLDRRLRCFFCLSVRGSSRCCKVILGGGGREGAGSGDRFLFLFVVVDGFFFSKGDGGRGVSTCDSQINLS